MNERKLSELQKEYRAFFIAMWQNLRNDLKEHFCVPEPMDSSQISPKSSN